VNLRNVALAVAAGVVVVVLFLRFGWRTEPQGPRAEAVASVSFVGGTASAAAAGQRRWLSSRETIRLGETVETAAGSSATLVTIAGHAELSLGAGAAVVFASPAEMTLSAGHVDARVPADLLLAIKTPHGRVLSREAVLSLEVGARDTQVAVRQGEALLENGRYPQRLGPGERMSLSAPQPAQAQR
jgi:hypothetical protein